MADTIKTSVRSVLTLDTWRGEFRCRNMEYAEETKNYSTILVPLKGDKLYLPIMALHYISPTKLNRANFPYDEIAIPLYHAGATECYKSMNVNIKKLITISSEHKLASFSVKIGDSIVQYFSSAGAIFDNMYNPIAMYMWEVEKIPEDNLKQIPPTDRIEYRLVRPILWVSVNCVTDKSSIHNYIVNTLIKESVTCTVYPSHSLQEIFATYKGSNSCIYPKVIIDDFPFKVLRVITPSINIKNEDLRKMVLEEFKNDN